VTDGSEGRDVVVVGVGIAHAGLAEPADPAESAAGLGRKADIGKAVDVIGAALVNRDQDHKLGGIRRQFGLGEREKGKTGGHLLRLPSLE